MPTVSGRDALWHAPEQQPVVVGIGADKRYVLATRLLDAEPDHRIEFPKPSIWPLLTAIAVSFLFITSIFTPWGIVWGAVPVFITMVGWFWPKAGKRPRELEQDIAHGHLTPREQVL
jgi:cytochrome c oxidase subunit 1